MHSRLRQPSSVTSLAARLGYEPRKHGVQALGHRLHACATKIGVCGSRRRCSLSRMRPVGPCTDQNCCDAAASADRETPQPHRCCSQLDGALWGLAAQSVIALHVMEGPEPAPEVRICKRALLLCLASVAAGSPAGLGCSWSGIRSRASSVVPPPSTEALRKAPLQSRYSTCRCRLARRRAAALIVSMPCGDGCHVSSAGAACWHTASVEGLDEQCSRGSSDPQCEYAQLPTSAQMTQRVISIRTAAGSTPAESLVGLHGE